MREQQRLGLRQQRGRWTPLLFSRTPRDSEDEEEEERVDVATEEAALKNIRDQLQGREKVQDEAQQLMFLHAIHPVCLAAKQRGQDMLELQCCKAAVMERIVDLHRVLPELLDAILGKLLAESPDTDRFHYILEHINYWIVSRVSQERARSFRNSTALLRFTITLPKFDVFSKFFSEGQRRFFLHTEGSAGHPRPAAVCQPGWAAPHLLPRGGSPATDGGQAGGRHGQSDGPGPEALQGLCL
ncbi:uncharacterized protein LOC120398420 [Mauremys reevesii]|uniref:uncharacterized protein LOC120398420 n=1 Tax=Mauremys reevesii TaxID=260615 RepID=UPI00193FBA53|nr:uncharacterized protein LOC120398420 [Mauremys reevesii]